MGMMDIRMSWARAESMTILRPRRCLAVWLLESSLTLRMEWTVEVATSVAEVHAISTSLADMVEPKFDAFQSRATRAPRAVPAAASLATASGVSGSTNLTQVIYIIRIALQPGRRSSFSQRSPPSPCAAQC